MIGLSADDGTVRRFESGATRSTGNKLDPFGFLSPIALHRFSEYMQRHRLQADKTLRDSDNWKKGMPKEEYIRSFIRHALDFWAVTSGEDPRFDKSVTDPEEIACAILFNIQGYLHELHTKRNYIFAQTDGIAPLERPMGSSGCVMDGLIVIDDDLSAEVDAAFERIQR
jgi:hypothetical protein